VFPGCSICAEPKGSQVCQTRSLSNPYSRGRVRATVRPHSKTGRPKRCNLANPTRGLKGKPEPVPAPDLDDGSGLGRRLETARDAFAPLCALQPSPL